MKIAALKCRNSKHFVPAFDFAGIYRIILSVSDSQIPMKEYC